MVTGNGKVKRSVAKRIVAGFDELFHLAAAILKES